MKSKKTITIICYAISILIIGYLGIKFIQKVIDDYEYYADFQMGFPLSNFTFTTFEELYERIEIAQRSTDDERILKKDIIFDYKEHEILPILNYLNNKNEDEILVEAFQNLTTFFENINNYYFDETDDIYVRQKNNKFYTLKNNIYTYQIKKVYIPKEEMQKLYQEYLNNTNIEKHFIDLLYNNSNIKKDFTYENLNNIINNDYDNFYKKYEQDIIKTISIDITNFSKYLNDNYIFKNFKDDNRIIELKKDINVKFITFDFKYTKLAHNYGKYNYYQLDLNDLIDQLNKYNLPLLYL